MYSPGLNFSREPPPIRSTYQSTPPPWHSCFFLESSLLKIGTFIFIPKDPIGTNCIFEKDHHLHLHKSQLPTGLKNKTKQNKTKNSPASTAPPPSPKHTHKNIVLCLVLCLVLWCARMCVCVCVCFQISSLKNTGPTEAKFNVEPPWERGRKFIQMVQIIYCFSLVSTSMGTGAFSRDSTINLSPQCRAFSRALKTEKLKAPLFPGPVGAGTTKDWCIIFTQNKDLVVTQ